MKKRIHTRIVSRNLNESRSEDLMIRAMALCAEKAAEKGFKVSTDISRE